MPRGPRLDAPGVLHHVIARGIERTRIFADDEDREAFLERLGDLARETKSPIYAWCLIPNHFHLLLRSGAASLSAVMHRLLAGYATNFNRRHRRTGHLFQNRFKSIVVEEQAYLLELIRYIHLNPVRAGLVPDVGALETYPWTGHMALLGRSRLPWQDVGFVLGQFGASLRAARGSYRRFVADGPGRERHPELTGGGLRRSLRGWRQIFQVTRGRERWSWDERILGSSEFVLRTLEELPPRIATADKSAIDDVVAAAAVRCGVGIEEIRSNSHRPAAVTARAVVSYIAIRRLGLTPTAVGRALGISRRSATRALMRAQQLGADELVRDTLAAC